MTDICLLIRVSVAVLTMPSLTSCGFCLLRIGAFTIGIIQLVMIFISIWRTYRAHNYSLVKYYSALTQIESVIFIMHGVFLINDGFKMHTPLRAEFIYQGKHDEGPILNFLGLVDFLCFFLHQFLKDKSLFFSNN